MTWPTAVVPVVSRVVRRRRRRCRRRRRRRLYHLNIWRCHARPCVTDTTVCTINITDGTTTVAAAASVDESAAAAWTKAYSSRWTILAFLRKNHQMSHLPQLPMTIQVWNYIMSLCVILLGQVAKGGLIFVVTYFFKHYRAISYICYPSYVETDKVLYSAVLLFSSRLFQRLWRPATRFSQKYHYNNYLCDHQTIIF